MKFPFSKKTDVSQPMYIELTETSPFAYVESYKSIRTNLDFMLEQNQCKRIVITSARPSEGKSTFALNLGITLAEDGHKVLIMDCDLRKPILHKYVRSKTVISHGLSAIIKDPTLLKDAIKHHPKYGVDFIFAGKIPPNPIELIGSAKMSGILDSLSEHYNYIICDTPPVSLMTDAATLSRFCDGVILVIKQKSSTRDQIKAAIKNLDSVNANILGAVLTQYNLQSSYSKGYDYYSYNYQYSTDEKRV